MPNAEKGDIIQSREYIQDPETGLMMGSAPEGGENLSDGADGDFEENSKSKPQKIGTVDFNDKDGVNYAIRDFEGRYAQADIERCIVVTTQGEVYEIEGERWTVDTTVLGDKMKGSINSHNHVAGESSYSFSKEDLESSVQDGGYRSEAFDEKYRYTMSFGKANKDMDVYEAYQEAKLEVDEILCFEPETIPRGDEQHERIKRACQKLGVGYERKRIS